MTPTPLQYRLSVDIGHLVVEAMHEGISATEAAGTLLNCLRMLERNIDFGMEQPPKRFRSLHHDAARYGWLRERDLNTIPNGGVFAGQMPENVVLNGIDLDHAVDTAMKSEKG